MAETSMSKTEALTKKVWEETLFRETKEVSYFSKFMKTSADSVVHVKEQLLKEKGDAITFGLIPRLEGDGVTGDTPVEGNEDELERYDFKVELEAYRKGVKSAGKLSDQRAVFDVPEESKVALKEWGGRKIDTLCFNALKASPTRIFYKPTGGANTTTTSLATAKAALVDNDDSYLSPQLLSFADTWCKTGGDRDQSPIRGVMINGKEYRVLLIHPDVGYDIRQDSTYAQYMREAEARGSENPVFTGALAIINGVVFHEHESVPKGLDAGSGGDVPYAHNFLMGAQALCWAWGMRPTIEDGTFDYKWKKGWAWSIIAGVEKAKFNSKDFGVVSILTSRTRISDAA